MSSQCECVVGVSWQCVSTCFDKSGVCLESFYWEDHWNCTIGLRLCRCLIWCDDGDVRGACECGCDVEWSRVGSSRQQMSAEGWVKRAALSLVATRVLSGLRSPRSGSPAAVPGVPFLSSTLALKLSWKIESSSVVFCYECHHDSLCATVQYFNATSYPKLERPCVVPSVCPGTNRREELPQ